MAGLYPHNVVIFEHGILANADELFLPLTPIATTKLPIYSGFSLAILDENGHSLYERAVNIADVDGPYRLKDYYDEEDVRYTLLASLYHLNRLIDLYVEVCQLFERNHPIGLAHSGNTSNPRVFYEIDAFLSAARRLYEAIRKVLWKYYKPPGAKGRWRSITTVVGNIALIPEPFASRLKHSWNDIGEKLRAYRDCIAHYDPLTAGTTTCWVKPADGRWAMTVKLPANPEKRSREAFDFDGGPDALSYCHKVACNLVGLCEALDEQPEISSHLANPSR